MAERLHENWTPKQIVGLLKSGAKRLWVLSYKVVYAWSHGRSQR